MVHNRRLTVDPLDKKKEWGIMSFELDPRGSTEPLQIQSILVDSLLGRRASTKKARGKMFVRLVEAPRGLPSGLFC